MKLIARILLTALALALVANFVPGIEISSLYVAVVTALILGLLNVAVKPVLVILTLPISIVTLGLFIFVINAGLFMFAASFIQGFEVDGFLVALLGSFVVTIVSSVGNKWIS